MVQIWALFQYKDQRRSRLRYCHYKDNQVVSKVTVKFYPISCNYIYGISKEKLAAANIIRESLFTDKG